VSWIGKAAWRCRSRPGAGERTHLGDVQQLVQRTLGTQYRDTSAEVSISRLRTVRVYVVGEVSEPGAYDISSLSTPLNALVSAEASRSWFAAFLEALSRPTTDEVIYIVLHEVRSLLNSVGRDMLKERSEPRGVTPPADTSAFNGVESELMSYAPGSLTSPTTYTRTVRSREMEPPRGVPILRTEGSLH